MLNIFPFWWFISTPQNYFLNVFEGLGGTKRSKNIIPVLKELIKNLTDWGFVLKWMMNGCWLLMFPICKLRVKYHFIFEKQNKTHKPDKVSKLLKCVNSSHWTASGHWYHGSGKPGYRNQHNSGKAFKQRWARYLFPRVACSWVRENSCR